MKTYHIMKPIGDHLKHLALMTMLAGASIPAQAQTIVPVGGDGTIGDTTLTTVSEGSNLVAKVPKDGAHWTAAGGENVVYSHLTSPTLTVPSDGLVTLTFNHRYNFENAWDGGAVYVSINGGTPTYVPADAFSANAYVQVLDSSALGGPFPDLESVFTGQSTGWGNPTPAYLASVATLGTFTAGDTIAIEFRGGWDWATVEPAPNWEISSVQVADSASTDMLNVDFLNGHAGFSVVSDAGLAGPFVYLGQKHQFEINGATLAADRYVPDTPGANTIIDLNDADLAVVLLAGTLNVGDSFTLFDLSGGTTLRGNYNSITLPDGTLWDLSELTVTGRIVCRAVGLGLLVSGYDSTQGTSYLNPITNLMAVTPSGTGTQYADINYGDFLTLPGITNLDTFAVLWEGWLDVTIDGTGDYTFGTASDDGSVLYLDLNDDGDFTDPGELIVNNNNIQGTTVVTGTVALTMNSVRMVIGFFEDGGGESMAARFNKGSALGWIALQPINGRSGHFSPTNPFAASLAKIRSFSPTSVIGEPVGNAADIAWTVRFGITDLTNLAPAFTLSDGAKCYDKNPATDPSAVEIFSGAHRDFSGTPVHYFVRSLDESTINDYTVTVDVGPEVPGLTVTDYARWFDASQITANDGDPVATWNDLSTNAANATVPSGNATPVYVANAGTESGLGAVYFAKNGGAGNSAALRFTRDSSIKTVFSVFKGNSFLLTDSDAYHFHRPGDDNPADPIWDGANSSGNITGGSTYVNGTLWTNGTSAAMPTDLHNGFNLVEVLTNGGTVQADSFNKDRVYHAGNQYQAEVIIYDRVLTEDERLTVENYLTAKWFGAYGYIVPKAEIVTFGPGATIGAVVANAASIEWSYPYGAPISNLTPTFTLSPGAKCYDKNPLTDPTALELTSGAPRDFTGGVLHYFVKSVDYIDLVNDYTVTVTETPVSEACQMLTFGIPGYPATIDEGTKTIAWKVPYGSLGSLSPVYTVSDHATGDPASGSTQNFTGPVTYRVNAEAPGVWQDYVVTATELPAPPGGTSVGPICWYDASTITGENGSTVNTWNDLSGFEHHATRGSGSVTLAANQLNSLPAVQLRGGGTYLDCAGAMFTKEQYVVVRSANAVWSNSGSFLARKGTGNSGARNSSYNLYSGFTGFWDDQLPSAVSKNGTAVSSGQGSMPRGGFELGTITEYMLLKITVNNQADAANLAAFPYYQIGRNDQLGTMDFDVAEIIGYGSTLTTEDETKLGSYLADKYGLFTAYPDLTPQALIGSFSLVGLPATVNQSARTIALTVPYGTDVTSLPSTFTMSAGAKCYSTLPVAPEVEIVSDVTTIDFTNPVHYFVQSSDGLVTNDYTVTITVSPVLYGTTPLVVTADATGDEILNDGTLVEANHFYSVASAVTLDNGLTFGIDWSHTSPTGLSASHQRTDTDAHGHVPLLDGSTPFGQLMRSYTWSSENYHYLNIPGLIPGHTYRLQLISGHDTQAIVVVEGAIPRHGLVIIPCSARSGPRQRAIRWPMWFSKEMAPPSWKRPPMPCTT